jgi:biopolymer transport protein ExbB
MAVCVGSNRSRLVRFLVACLLLSFVCSVLVATPTPARAQDGDKKEGEAPAAAPKEEPSFISHVFESVGPVFGFILFIAYICLVALIVLLAMDLRMGVAIPAAFVDEFTDIVNKRQFKQAYELCRSDNSFLGRVLSAGMGRLQYGIEDARETAQNMVESVRAGKEQLINYVGTIGTLGPMLGLVGTVYGMILSFMELSGGGTPKPEKLAAGISHALVVTLLGIALSVPAIFCHTFFKNRLTRIAMDSSNLADDLLTQMYHNSKKAGTPAAPATPAPTAAPAAARADQRGIRPSE